MQLADLIQKQYDFTDWQASRSLQSYLQSVVIACDPNPRKFGEVAEKWQREDIIRPKVKAMEWVAGLTETYDGPTSFMDILPRGHDKSSLEGRLAAWLLAYSRRPIFGYLIAADQKQAAGILEAMKSEAKLNPWLNEKLEFVRNTIRGPAGSIEALASDAGGSYGLRGNVHIFDEFTHWQNDSMWRAVYSGSHKRERSLCIVISNAGLLDSWQDLVRRQAKRSPNWHVFEAPDHLASWLSKSKLAEIEAGLPPGEAARVLHNQWIDAVMEADYIRRYEVQNCVDTSLSRATKPQDQYQYLLTWDYGRVNDRSVGVVGHLDEHGRVVVDVMDVFAGNKNRPITIEQVEEWVDRMTEVFNPTRYIMDVYQLEGTIQKLEQRGKNVTRFTGRSGAGNMEMAMVLRDRIVNKRLVWYPGCGDLLLDDGGTETLESELAALRVKRMPYGFRFDHDNQKHDDRAVALGMLALYASEHPAHIGSTVELLDIPTTPIFQPWGLR